MIIFRLIVAGYYTVHICTLYLYLVFVPCICTLYLYLVFVFVFVISAHCSQCTVIIGQGCSPVVDCGWLLLGYPTFRTLNTERYIVFASYNV